MQIFSRGSRSITICTETLKEVLTRNSVPSYFDLMIMDVEGSEEGIVRSLLGGPWRPKVLIIELCDVHPDFVNNSSLTGSHRRVRESLVTDGYREHVVHPINTIFIRDQSADREAHRSDNGGEGGSFAPQIFGPNNSCPSSVQPSDEL